MCFLCKCYILKVSICLFVDCKSQSVYFLLWNKNSVIIHQHGCWLFISWLSVTTDALLIAGSKMVGWQLCSNASYPFPAAGFSLPPPGPVSMSLRLLKLDRGLQYYLLEAAYSLLAQVHEYTLRLWYNTIEIDFCASFFKSKLVPFFRGAPGCPERPPSTSSWPHLSRPSPETCLWTWTSTQTDCCWGLPIRWKPSLYKVSHSGRPL